MVKIDKINNELAEMLGTFFGCYSGKVFEKLSIFDYNI